MEQVMCEVESFPSYFKFLKDLTILLFQYWTGNYDHTNCNKFAPSYTRIKRADLILLLIVTTFFAALHLIVRPIFLRVYWRNFPHISHLNAHRCAEISCDCIVRLSLIMLSLFVLFSTAAKCSVLWSGRDIVANWHVGLMTGQQVPFLLRLTLALQAGSYIWATISLFIGSKRKDFMVLLAHHVVTVGLLFIGYTYMQPVIGVWIALLHDVVDPFIDVMRIVKCLHLLRVSLFNDLLYVFCLILWVGSRLYLFPLTAINPIVVLSFLNPTGWCAHEYIGSVTSLLTVLLFLNFVWSVFILRLGFFRLWYGIWTDVTVEGRQERRHELRRRKQL